MKEKITKEVVSKQWCLKHLEQKGLKCQPAWFYRRYKDRLIQIPTTDNKSYYDKEHFLNLIEQDLLDKREKIEKSNFIIVG